jgi:hypothetical protein
MLRLPIFHLQWGLTELLTFAQHLFVPLHFPRVCFSVCLSACLPACLYFCRSVLVDRSLNITAHTGLCFGLNVVPSVACVLNARMLPCLARPAQLCTSLLLHCNSSSEYFQTKTLVRHFRRSLNLNGSQTRSCIPGSVSPPPPPSPLLRFEGGRC